MGRRCLEREMERETEDDDARLHCRVDQGNGAQMLYITGGCAEIHWPELLCRLGGRIYVATGAPVDPREYATRRKQACKDYSILVQGFPQETLAMYIEEFGIPLFGVKNRRCRFERAKSRGEIHCHMPAICEEKQPHMAPAKWRAVTRSRSPTRSPGRWARGALSLAALHPADTPGGAPDTASVRAPGGEWGPPKDINADEMIPHDSEPVRHRNIARANSDCSHGYVEYFARAPGRFGGRCAPARCSGSAEW